jgi:hypothetical protein
VSTEPRFCTDRVNASKRTDTRKSGFKLGGFGGGIAKGALKKCIKIRLFAEGETMGYGSEYGNFRCADVRKPNSHGHN